MPAALTEVSVRIWPGIAPQWPALAADGPLLTSSPWLNAVAGRLGDQLITIVVTQDGEAKLAALATVHRRPAPGEFFDLHHVVVTAAPVLPLTESARAARAGLAAAAPPPEHWVPNLIVMLPGYECVPVGPGRDDLVLLRELVRAAVSWAEQQNLATVAFLYTYAEPAGLGLALAEGGFTAMPLSRTWVLPVPDGGFSAYLATLPQKRRAEAGRELRRLEKAGVRLRQLEPGELTDEPTLGRLAALRAQMQRKYRGKADDQRELAKLRQLLTDVCDGRAIVFGAEADGELVGFTLFCPHGDSWYCLTAGYDYADPRSRFCYFATAYYFPLPVAARAGVRSLAFGQGSARAKKSRGCVGLPLTGWIRSAEPALTAAIQASALVTELEPA
jgi:Peptidogalycan biosysnthesis/recognition